MDDEMEIDFQDDAKQLLLMSVANFEFHNYNYNFVT